jgi:hypothetical protein
MIERFLRKDLVNELNKAYAPLTQEEEVEQIRLAKQGCEKAFEKLFNSQALSFITFCKTQAGVSAEHFLGSCVLALHRTIQDFDESMGVRMFHYLKRGIHIIKQEDMLDTNVVRYHNLVLRSSYRNKMKEQYEEYMCNIANKVTHDEKGRKITYRQPFFDGDIKFVEITENSEHSNVNCNEYLSTMALSHIAKLSKNKTNYGFDFEEVLMKVAEGYSIDEIASEMGNTELEIRKYSALIRRKLKEFGECNQSLKQYV